MNRFWGLSISGKLSYVLTSRNLSTTRADVLFVKGGVESYRVRSEEGYKRVWLMGGGFVASSFIREDWLMSTSSRLSQPSWSRNLSLSIGAGTEARTR